MKRRQRKARCRRMVREAIRAGKKDAGDHRRWWWMATMPRPGRDDWGEYIEHFDPKAGRCYEYPSGIAEEPEPAPFVPGILSKPEIALT